ncbi:hypothetical protein, partial [Streptomyces sp. NPDC127084]|uniref:hypothetical protein n=1 Tax=Streptomyces sp. NPDC127084 TaxID=3347133 RepID=UPI003646F5BB
MRAPELRDTPSGDGRPAAVLVDLGGHPPGGDQGGGRLGQRYGERVRRLCGGFGKPEQVVEGGAEAGQGEAGFGEGPRCDRRVPLRGVLAYGVLDLLMQVAAMVESGCQVRHGVGGGARHRVGAERGEEQRRPP